MSDSNNSVWGFIKGFGKLVIGLLLVLQGLVGLFVLLMVVSVAVGVANGVGGNTDKVQVAIPDGVALHLNPNGVIVEQAEDVDPFTMVIEEAYGANRPMEIEVHDLVKAIRKAKDDKRITGLVLDLGKLFAPTSSASKVHYIAEEIRKFKESGKKVVAVGDFYSQDQYLLAASADEIHMNDYGNIVIPGYGRYGTFYKSFLEKIKVTTHVFRVGTFKSAVEPVLRDSMSEEAKEANQQYLDFLWSEYTDAIEDSRGLERGAIKNYANNFHAITKSVKGDFAKAALNNNLVDTLSSRAEQVARLRELFGDDKDGESFKNVGYRRYLTALGATEDDSDPNVAIVTAAGPIVDGKAPAGDAAGGDSVAALLKKARTDDKVKAVVLRVDSAGGSAFASDIIRDELLAIKAAGKPVVASMGSLAASGGYWISASADEIWAAPTTITGSIGIFGVFNTYENTASELGIFVDGVGTTTLSSMMAAGIGPLSDEVGEILQESVENGYDRFLTIVGEGRQLDKSYVDSVGQGRVWIGEKAETLRLVDKIGNFDSAIARAAELAELEKYDVVEMTDKKTPFEQFISSISAQALEKSGLTHSASLRRKTLLQKVVNEFEKQLEFFNDFNDPNAVYARCLNC